MRGIVLSALAIVASSTVAFFAGARSGLGESDCAADPEPQVAASVDPLVAEPTDQPASEPALRKEVTPDQRDEAAWPHTVWARDDDAPGERIYSKTRLLWIRPEPKRSTKFLGYLSLGDSVRLKGGSRKAAHAGKSRSVYCDDWYEVEPRGYVCLNEEESTSDPNDRVFKELLPRRADRMAAWPYRYGESTATPVYGTVPPLHKQRRQEPGLDGHLRKVREARQAKTEAERVAISPTFAGVDLGLTGEEAPTLLQLGPRARTAKTKVVRGSTIAYTDEFDASGRGWLMTWDRGIIPRDRVKKYDESTFHGVELTDDVKLPIAFFRGQQPKYRRTDNGVEATGDYWPRHGWVPITQESIDHDGKRYLVTKEDGLLSGVDGVSVARRSLDIPLQIQNQPSGRRTWVDVSIMRGWLVAYEYDKPVYATLVSPGRGGIPKDGVDPLETASTPVGRFRITGKFVTATMVSNASLDIVHDEVMYTQNFSGPYALHGAYWHDAWGEKMSGGCLNLSPVDARRLFAWTEPTLPAGWHAVQLVTGYEGALAEYQSATLVYVHK